MPTTTNKEERCAPCTPYSGEYNTLSPRYRYHDSMRNVIRLPGCRDRARGITRRAMVEIVTNACCGD